MTKVPVKAIGFEELTLSDRLSAETNVDPSLPPYVVRFDILSLICVPSVAEGGLNTGLPEQSIKILALLLEKPGELVLHEDIRKKLWPNDTSC
jgi:hypothetical protein